MPNNAQNNQPNNQLQNQSAEPVIHTVEELDKTLQNKPVEQTQISNLPETDYKALYEAQKNETEKYKGLYNKAVGENNKLFQRLTSKSPSQSNDEDFKKIIAMY